MNIADYLISAVMATLQQLLFLMGPMLSFTILMNFISTKIEKTALSLLGTKVYLFVFAWLGTAFHELSHALFALLFGHQIVEIKLFKPDKETGSLGYVSHRYNPRNWYHQLGNFFIGIGPVIVGTAVLFLLFFLLFDIGLTDLPQFQMDTNTLQTGEGLMTQFKLASQSLLFLFDEVFRGPQSSWWRITLLLYGLLVIGSSITLSGSDVKTAFIGFLMIVLLLLVFNLATGWIQGFAHELTRIISGFISLFSTIMLTALLINLIMFMLLGLLLLLKRMANYS